MSEPKPLPPEFRERLPVMRPLLFAVCLIGLAAALPVVMSVAWHAGLKNYEPHGFPTFISTVLLMGVAAFFGVVFMLIGDQNDRSNMQP